MVRCEQCSGPKFRVEVHPLPPSPGFRVLVPDLYRGALGVDAEEAHHLMSNLDWPGAVEDVRGAAKFLKGEGSAKVGIAGFCMGGALACAGATLVEEIDAGVVFYGTPDPALADPSRLTKPMQAHFGEGDHLEGFSNPDRANWLEEQFRAAGIEYEFHRYPRVGHAFMNSSKEYVERKRALGFGEHDAEAVRQAWDRFFAFCHKHLD